jgi:2'-5' RNA ligase
MRLFVGIPLSEAVVRELAALTERLKAQEDGLRWSAATGWHITLQFLGSATEDQFACVMKGLAEIRARRFAVELEAPGFFDRAGVFFVGVRQSPELVGLQRLVTAATEPCGFEPEERPYHPHITLARSKGGLRALKVLKEKAPEGARFSGFVAGEFVLYESYPGPGGSRYEKRGVFALTA